AAIGGSGPGGAGGPVQAAGFGGGADAAAASLTTARAQASKPAARRLRVRWPGASWRQRPREAALWGGLGYRCGEVERKAVGVCERQHVDAERGQPGDVAVGHALLVEQPGGLLQVVAAGDAEAEVAKAYPVRVEPVTFGRHRPQPQQQVAADHDHAAEQDAERLGLGRVAGRR